jgi:hypothetical protein
MTKPLKLKAIRNSLRRLDEIAEMHPELKEGEAAWKDNLEELEHIVVKSTAERQRDWRERQKAMGLQRLTIWLDQKALRRLERLLKARGFGPRQRTEGMIKILGEALALLEARERKTKREGKR